MNINMKLGACDITIKDDLGNVVIQTGCTGETHLNMDLTKLLDMLHMLKLHASGMDLEFKPKL